VSRDPDRVLSPDAAFTSVDRLAVPPAKGWFPCAPDFALEVRSPEQAWEGVLVKAGVWIAHRTSVVWALDPAERRLVELRPGSEPVVVGPEGAASGLPALPGWTVRLPDLFRGLPAS
jgi:Uma2 family endonuclease